MYTPNDRFISVWPTFQVHGGQNSGTVPADNVYGCIDSIYASIVSTLGLRSIADSCIPKCRKGFFKFWWNEDLSLHKRASVDSDRLWKEAGKPRSGPIFAHRQSCRSQYRHRLRQMQNMSANFYSNSLHDALLMKDGAAFWRCWRSKFDSNPNALMSMVVLIQMLLLINFPPSLKIVSHVITPVSYTHLTLPTNREV